MHASGTHVTAMQVGALHLCLAARLDAAARQRVGRARRGPAPCPARCGRGSLGIQICAVLLLRSHVTSGACSSGGRSPAPARCEPGYLTSSLEQGWAVRDVVCWA